MPQLNVVTFTEIAEVEVLENPEDLLAALRDIVKPGITGQYDDAVWMYYYGLTEKLAMSSDPLFHAIIDRLGGEGEHVDELAQPDVMPTTDRLVRNMLDMGGFWRVESLDEQRYVIAPAKHFPKKQSPKELIPIDLTHAVTFSGHILVEAMFNEGSNSEIIDYRAEPEFSAYRTAVIGQFFAERLIRG